MGHRVWRIGYRVWGIGVLFFNVVCANIAQASSVCAQETCVNVEVVSTMEGMRRGLQGREALAENQGMLFAFDNDDFQKFWMKDMKFAIDMIWIDNQRRIVSIASARPPCMQETCEVYSPSQKARYVLEVPAGFALAHQFKEGVVFEFKEVKIKP